MASGLYSQHVNNKKMLYLRNTIIILVLVTLAVCCLFPLFYMIVNSFGPAVEAASSNRSVFPTSWSLDSYKAFFSFSAYSVKWLANTFVVSACQVLGNVVFASLAGYAFAKLKFKLSKPLFMVFLCSMMIPLEATIVSNYLTLSAMGLMDTFFAVISTSIVSVFGVFLLRQFYMTIPDALLEAARIDGASEVQSFVRIILPLGKSAMATIAIIGFIGSWNSYLWPLIITNSMELRTVQTGLRAMMTLDVGVEWQQLMAMSTLITVPTIILFVALQKYFVQGITKVGIK